MGCCLLDLAMKMSILIDPEIEYESFQTLIKYICEYQDRLYAGS